MRSDSCLTSGSGAESKSHRYVLDARGAPKVPVGPGAHSTAAYEVLFGKLGRVHKADLGHAMALRGGQHLGGGVIMRTLVGAQVDFRLGILLALDAKVTPLPRQRRLVE